MPLNTVAACSCRLSKGKTKAGEQEECTLCNYISVREGKHFGPILWPETQVFVLFFYYIALHVL